MATPDVSILEEGSTSWRLQRFSSILLLGTCSGTWGLPSQVEQSDTTDNHKDVFKPPSKSYDVPISGTEWVALVQVHPFCFLRASRTASRNTHFSTISSQTTVLVSPRLSFLRNNRKQFGQILNKGCQLCPSCNMTPQIACSPVFSPFLPHSITFFFFFNFQNPKYRNQILYVLEFLGTTWHKIPTKYIFLI